MTNSIRLGLGTLGLLLDAGTVVIFQFWPPPFGLLYLAVMLIGMLGLLLLLIAIQRVAP